MVQFHTFLQYLSNKYQITNRNCDKKQIVEIRDANK